MSFATCIVPVAPLRADPSHKSEMVSQLLLGESGLVLEETKDHVKVRCMHDDYEGWCQRSQLFILEEAPTQLNQSMYIGDWTAKITINGKPAHAPMGAPLPAEKKAEIKIGPYHIQYENVTAWDASKTKFNPKMLSEKAFQVLNTSYLWGGRSVFGIDCSGYTQLIFRLFNYKLLRDAYLQATQGEAIGFLQEAKCGDLAFFDNAEGRITHVGILLNDQQIIHSSGKVRIDLIDNEGIINSDTRERTHKLRVIKRYF
jgi:cell wall-associated NlpC family hydrolase